MMLDKAISTRDRGPQSDLRCVGEHHQRENGCATGLHLESDPQMLMLNNGDPLGSEVGSRNSTVAGVAIENHDFPPQLLDNGYR